MSLLSALLVSLVSVIPVGGSGGNLVTEAETLLKTVPAARWQGSVDSVATTVTREYSALDTTTGILSIEFDWNDEQGGAHTLKATSNMHLNHAHVEVQTLEIDGKAIEKAYIALAPKWQLPPALAIQFDYPDPLTPSKTHVVRFDAHPG